MANDHARRQSLRPSVLAYDVTMGSTTAAERAARTGDQPHEPLAWLVATGGMIAADYDGPCQTGDDADAAAPRSEGPQRGDGRGLADLEEGRQRADRVAGGETLSREEVTARAVASCRRTHLFGPFLVVHGGRLAREICGGSPRGDCD